LLCSTSNELINVHTAVGGFASSFATLIALVTLPRQQLPWGLVTSHLQLPALTCAFILAKTSVVRSVRSLCLCSLPSC
jgi:hypothetical protein